MQSVSCCRRQGERSTEASAGSESVRTRSLDEPLDAPLSQRRLPYRAAHAIESASASWDFTARDVCVLVAALLIFFGVQTWVATSTSVTLAADGWAHEAVRALGFHHR